MENNILKEKFHQLIDKIDNNDFLESLYESLLEHTKLTSNEDILDDLTKDQQNQLAESIKQSYEGKVIPDFVVREEVRRWLSK